MNEMLIFFKIPGVFRTEAVFSKKWTKNETLIFFKVQGVFIKYRTEAVFTKREMSN